MDQIRYLEAKTRTVDGTNGVSYAYRRVGPDGGRPLVLLQHFRGNLENWDPDLIDGLSASRDVVVFDNTGVGATTGSTPTTIAQMADDAIVFVEALGLTEIDLLGFSIGSFVAQELVLTRRSLVVKLILASTAPQGAPGMHGWAPDIITAIGEPRLTPRDSCTDSSPTPPRAEPPARGSWTGSSVEPKIGTSKPSCPGTPISRRACCPMRW